MDKISDKLLGILLFLVGIAIAGMCLSLLVGAETTATIFVILLGVTLIGTMVITLVAAGIILIFDL